MMIFGSQNSTLPGLDKDQDVDGKVEHIGTEEQTQKQDQNRAGFEFGD